MKFSDHICAHLSGGPKPLASSEGAASNRASASAVVASDHAGVREATLGGLDPLVVAVLDVPLFVVGSALAAAGIRAAAVIATAWTLLVTLALAGYATITTEAGWGVVAMAAASAGSVVALLEVILGRVPTEWIMRGPFAFRVARPRQGRAVEHGEAAVPPAGAAGRGANVRSRACFPAASTAARTRKRTRGTRGAVHRFPLRQTRRTAAEGIPARTLSNRSNSS